MFDGNAIKDRDLLIEALLPFAECCHNPIGYMEKAREVLAMIGEWGE